VIRRGLVAAALAAALGCTRSPPAAPAEAAPVARVNGEPVDVASVRRELPSGAGEPGSTRPALDAAIDRLLLLQEARARGVTVSDGEVAQAIAALRTEYPDAAFDELLARERTSLAELEARTREQLVVERLVARAALQGVEVGADEVRAWYDAHRSELGRGEEVRARQVLVRTRAAAEDVRRDVARRPASFADVARRSSVAPEAGAGGDLGWFGRGSGMPEVFDVCFDLAPGAISPIVESPYGFHVFQVVERRGPAAPSFEEARAAIAERLLRDRRARAQEDFLAQLRAKAKIEIDEAALAAATRGNP
jgi:peptidyl-prolyl cis-trans isomerase C